MIVHILPNDASGGTQAVTLGHVSALASVGRDQAVVFMSPPSEKSVLRDRLSALGAVVHYLPLEGNVAAFSVRLLGLFREVNVTEVLTHGLGLHVIIAPVARLGGARRVSVLVGNPIAEDHPRIRSLRRRCRMAAGFVDTIVACSDHVAGTIVQHLRVDQRTVRVIPNPLDVESIRRRADSKRRRRRGDETAVLCIVARLDPIKDHETVIRSAAELLERGRRVLLRIVGSGPTEPCLRELAETLGIAGSVEFLGDRSDIPEILGDSDVFVYGMTWDEGFGVAVAEAMAARTPIVCTHVGPAFEVLAAGMAGRLVPPRDAAAMADAIELLLDDSRVREGLVEEASRVATARHDFDHLREQLDELLGR